MRFSFFALVIAFPLNGWTLDVSDRQQIEERIKPIGQVNLATENKPSSTTPGQNATGTNTSKEFPGQATYEQYCLVCHRDGIAGAPKFRDKADWQARLDNKTLDDLVASANKGKNAMPIKGTCMQCSDEEIKNAIQYMLPQS